MVMWDRNVRAPPNASCLQLASAKVGPRVVRLQSDRLFMNGTHPETDLLSQVSR